MSDGDAKRTDEVLTRWVEEQLGGRVVAIETFARWRMAWNIDVEVDGRIIELHARGERELNFAIPARLADEAPIHDLLEAHGLPVPHVYGICEAIPAMVMDRIPGHVDLTFAGTDLERHDLIDQYLALLPSIYAIDNDAIRAARLSIPVGAKAIALDNLVVYENVHDQLMTRPDPTSLFLRKWLHRNAPAHRDKAVFITADAFQFMFDGGRVTKLLDFELAYVGDPMMDLASLRVRDTIKNLGDLSVIAQRFAEITGWEVDHDVVDYYAVMYNTFTVLSAAPPLQAPAPTTDYVSHLAWWVNSARWAFEVIAEIKGFELETLPLPTAVPSPRTPLHNRLFGGLRRLPVDARHDYERRCLQQLARHLRCLDDLWPQLEAENVADVGALIGRGVDAAGIDAALLAFIETAGPELDEAIIRTLDRMVQRSHMTMAPAGSLMLRHPKLRSLRPDRQSVVGPDDGWPAGAIPGT